MEKKKVLLVDDQTDILSLEVAILESEGYEVRKEESPSNALYAISCGYRPDLVISDLDMRREGGGLDFIAKIKASEETKYTPLLILSCDFRKEVAVKRAGADYFLSKPFDIYTLADKVREILEKHQPYDKKA